MSDDLYQRFPKMTPMGRAPSMATINGVGFMVYGRRDADAETETYVKTLCFTVLYVPLFALRAYRVADAPRGGWYFIGREPLSGVARVWNVLFPALLVALIWFAVESSKKPTPAELAQRQMKQAAEHAAKGELADAARIYHGLAMAGAEQAGPAAAAMAGLIDGPCATAPWPQSVRVYDLAVNVSRRRQTPEAAALVASATKLAQARGGESPSSAVAVLDSVRPLQRDTRPIDELRFNLLSKWAAAEPTNLQCVAPLAMLLEQRDKIEQAKALLLPLQGQLGSGVGARVLGMILAREGKHDEAEALLRTYVDERLAALKKAEDELESAGEAASNRAFAELDRRPPEGFESKYNAASADQQKAMVREYVTAAVRADSTFQAAQAALSEASDVVPAAFELGFVLLQRAQSEPSAELRRTRLKSAEQTFLAIAGVAGDDEQYKVTLGEVYYRLGEQEKGSKLFDELLTKDNRSYKSLCTVSGSLRQVGDEPRARALAEEAYKVASSNDERYAVAMQRAAMATDADDRLVWLKRSDQSMPANRASVAEAEGDHAMAAGDYATAAASYRKAAAELEKMTPNAWSLNLQAIALRGAFSADGDRKALERSVELFQQALDQSPRDVVLMLNYADAMLDASMSDVLDDLFDLRKLQSQGGTRLAWQAFADEAGRTALVARMKEHPGLKKAIATFERLTVLMPRNGRPYAALSDLYQLMQNEPALLALEARSATADIDTSDDLANARKLISGEQDAKRKTSAQAAYRRVNRIAADCRAVGGRTAAAALLQLADLELAMAMYEPAGRDRAAVQKGYELAAEANRLAPSYRTRSRVASFRMLRAISDLRANHADIDAYATRFERTVGSYAAILQAAVSGSMRERIITHPDFVASVDEWNALRKSFPAEIGVYDWMMRRAIGDVGAAEKIASTLRASRRHAAEVALDFRTEPWGPNVLESVWFHEAVGRPAEARAIRDMASRNNFAVPSGE